MFRYTSWHFRYRFVVGFSIMRWDQCMPCVRSSSLKPTRYISCSVMPASVSIGGLKAGCGCTGLVPSDRMLRSSPESPVLTTCLTGYPGVVAGCSPVQLTWRWWPLGNADMTSVCYGVLCFCHWYLPPAYDCFFVAQREDTLMPCSCNAGHCWEPHSASGPPWRREC
jgi:hypothetical protein